MTSTIQVKSPMESSWTTKSSTILTHFSVDPAKGLALHDVDRLLLEHGPNSLRLQKRVSRWNLLFKQLKNPVVYVLIIAAVIAFILGERLDGWAILSIVILNALIGLVQESKAESAIEALAAMSSPKGRVLREGNIKVVESETICPGDILILEAGDYVVADARIIQSRQLACDESILTGESLPVEKHSDPLQDGAPLAERFNMLYASTAISRGTAKAVVVSTGMNTEIGKIAELMEATQVGRTPLQLKLEMVSRKLLLVGGIVIILVIVIGLARGRELLEVVMSALSLSIAAIPEGLPTIVTVALVMAVRRMSKKKALVRKMDSVETLGATDIICTDKTGTLTTGKMVVRESYAHKIPPEDLKKTMVFCNNASLEGEGSGDTTELALLEFAKAAGTDVRTSGPEGRRLFEWSFDSGRKRMSVAVSTNDKSVIHVKGAPEAVILKCNLSPEEVLEINQKISEYSKKGMRVLAFASKETSQNEFKEMTSDEAESDLKFLGLVAMADPPRLETIESIRKCQASGIKIIMITGDHPLTAAAIAHELGIIKAPDERVLTGAEMDALSDEELKEISNEILVYARVSPENKLKLVDALKSKGHIVAMTGDGVNDAPALKTASIGVAMGKGGTEVARQASSIILTDDNFATIVDAVEEGRAVNGNIKRTLQYLLSTNLAELLFILTAAIVGWPVPLHPINLLWLNLVSDGLPALALAAEKVPEEYLQESNKPSAKSFFDPSFYREMTAVGVVITIMSLLVYRFGLNQFDALTARSLVFSFLVYSILLRSLSCRSDSKTFFEMKPNYYLLLAILTPLVFQLGMQQSDLLLDIFKIKALPIQTNLILLGLGMIPVTLVEIYKIWRRR